MHIWPGEGGERHHGDWQHWGTAIGLGVYLDEGIDNIVMGIDTVNCVSLSITSAWNTAGLISISARHGLVNTDF